MVARVRAVYEAILYPFFRIWMRPSGVSSGARLSYGGKLPGQGEKASGGAVKLVKLAQAFPECGRTANLLYLVSSALPRDAWARAKAIKKASGFVVLNQNGVAYPAWASDVTMKKVNERNLAIALLSNHVVFQSVFCRDAFARWVGKVPASHSIIYNPVDTLRFSRKEAHFVPPYDVLLMGSVAQRERIRLPLEAVSLIGEKKLRVRIAGKLNWPGAEQDLQNWIRELGLGGRVDWTGAYTQSDAPDIFRGAKVLVHLQDKDASPTVPLEAMACGTPVVGIRSGGMPELIPNELGRLIDVTAGWESFYYPKPAEIAVSIEDLLGRYGDLSGPCARHVAENFSSALFIDLHRKILRNLTKED